MDNYGVHLWNPRHSAHHRREEYHCPQGFCDQTGWSDSALHPDCELHRLKMIPVGVWSARWGKDS
jgi:hypothetical protein